MSTPFFQENVCLVGENPRSLSRHRRDARVYGHTSTAMHDNYIPGIYGLGWRRLATARCCETRLSLGKLDDQLGVKKKHFRRSPRLVVEIHNFCAGRTLTPHKGDARIT